MKTKRVITTFAFLAIMVCLVSSQVEETKAAQIGKFKTKDFVFDLKKSKPLSQSGGNTLRLLTLALFPALAQSGVTIAYLELEPCGINLPHIHPRATEILFVISAENLQVGFIEENSENKNKAHVNNITDGQVTIFPQGYIQFQQNLGCKPALFLSALASEDPGIVTISLRGFELPDLALESTYILSAKEIDSIRSKLPTSPANGTAECLKRCKIKPY